VRIGVCGSHFDFDFLLFGGCGGGLFAGGMLEELGGKLNGWLSEILRARWCWC